jgi:hypothetical protein
MYYIFSFLLNTLYSLSSIFSCIFFMCNFSYPCLIHCTPAFVTEFMITKCGNSANLSLQGPSFWGLPDPSIRGSK